ncbi:MAG TPA: hypothetical protein VNN19_05230 [bacterium]|nr:hypothetical protein [bacterium]
MAERLEGLVRDALRTGALLLAIGLLAAATERSTVFRSLDRGILRHRPLLLGAASVIAAAGFALFMGTVVYALVTQGPATPGGRSFGDAVTLGEIKEAYLTGAWRSDRFWRLTLLTASGAMTMALGIFSVVFVLGPSVVRALIAGGVLYTGWRLVLGWSQV